MGPGLERLPEVVVDVPTGDVPDAAVVASEDVPVGEPTDDTGIVLNDGEVLLEVDGEPVAPPPWKKKFELGFNGATGNSEATSLRFKAVLSRKTDYNESKFDINYANTFADSVETQNNLLHTGRTEWFLPDRPWTFFIAEQVEFDEFKAFNVRVSVNSGLGRKLIDNDRTNWKARLGFGASREIGGPDDSYVPELTVGSDLEHSITEFQKLIGSIQTFHDVTEFGDFRLQAEAAWEVIVDPDSNLTLKLSALDRYDSTPNGAQANDLTYAALVVWEF